MNAALFAAIEEFIQQVEFAKKHPNLIVQEVSLKDALSIGALAYSYERMRMEFERQTTK